MLAAGKKIEVTFDEAQEGVKAWSEGNMFAVTVKVKCSSSTTVSDVLCKLERVLEEDVKKVLAQGAPFNRPGTFYTMGPQSLTFEGDTLDGARSLADCGILDGATLTQVGEVTRSEVPCHPLCPCCCTAPEGAWMQDGGKVYQVGGSGVAPGSEAMERGVDA